MSVAGRRVLFVYFSYTQQTRRVADTMASALTARDYEVTQAALEFSDPHYGKRFAKLPMSWPMAKIVGMLPAQVRRKTSAVGIPAEAAGGDYDLVVIGSPTWWLTTCMPVRSYLHDPAAANVLNGRPFAVFTTSRRYFKSNIKTVRELGEKHGGRCVGDTHFVSDGNQVMSMWSWLVFMRHNVEKRRWFGVPLPKPNLSDGFDRQAVDFINRVSAEALAHPTPEKG